MARAITAGTERNALRRKVADIYFFFPPETGEISCGHSARFTNCVAPALRLVNLLVFLVKTTGKNAREKIEDSFSRARDLFPGTSPEGREKVHPYRGDFFPPGGSGQSAGNNPGCEFVPEGGAHA